MNKARVIYHLARADFLERVRRYSFLIMLGLTVFLGYQVAIGNMTIVLDEYRGEFNSAWVGATMTFFASFFLGIFGFYLVKGSVARDRETGVGQIMAATPMTKPLYLVGKWLSNLALLMTMVGILALAGIGIQYIAGESTRLNPPALFAPFIIITLPLMAVTSAVALLFESVDGLKGGLGNVLFFITALIIFPGLDELSKVSPFLDGFEPVGTAVFRRSMTAAAAAAFPEYGGGFAPGSPAPPHTLIFHWAGVDWTPDILLKRLSFFVLAALLIFIAAKFFDRFDSAPVKPKKRMRSSAVMAEIKPPLQPSTVVHLSPLPPASSRFSFLHVLRAELKLLLKGQPWWWFAVAGLLILACYLLNVVDAIYSIEIITSAFMRQYLLPVVLVWPLLIWSAMGSREVHNNVHQFTYSSKSPLWRQLPAQWLAGFLVTLLVASGAILRLSLDGDTVGLIALLSGVFFIPSLALAAGVWSGTSKIFEVVYLVIWYLGPVNGVGRMDYLGANSAGNIGFFIPLSIALIFSAFVGRAAQLQN